MSSKNPICPKCNKYLNSMCWRDRRNNDIPRVLTGLFYCDKCNITYEILMQKIQYKNVNKGKTLAGQEVKDG